MAAIRLAVVSDLHCHPSSLRPPASFLHSDALRGNRSHHPVQALLDLISERSLTANVLLAPGDLTHGIDKQGFLSGWGFVKEVAEALGADLVAVTLGNHDVDSRKRHGSDPLSIARQLDPSFPFKSTEACREYWAEGFAILRHEVARILVVNTVMHHHSEEDAKRGAVEEPQLAKIDRALRLESPPPFQVAVFHHHPLPHEGLGLGSDDLMVNGSLLLGLLEKHRFSLAVHGHKHYPRLTYSSGRADAVPVFAAGSLAANNPTVLSNTRNLFHIVELNAEPIVDCQNAGRIESWVYGLGQGWRTRHTQAADFPAIAGFGCRSNPISLASTTDQIITRLGVRVATWQRIADALPQIDYLLPQDAASYRHHLRADHGLAVAEDELGNRWIGMPEGTPK